MARQNESFSGTMRSSLPASRQKCNPPDHAMNRLAQNIERLMGVAPRHITGLHGGSVSQVYRAQLGSEWVVIKVDSPEKLGIESQMLRYLGTQTALEVPEVLVCEDGLLVMTYVENDGDSTSGAEDSAAAMLSGLHSIEADAFGFEFDTLIGGLHQPNPWTKSWVEFFGEHRLRYMATECSNHGRLGAREIDAVEELISRLPELLPAESTPRLIHGDLWGGNILFNQGRVAGLVDPAIYFADAEIELAFSTLFSTFSPRFYKVYSELMPIADVFWEWRKDLYNVYPLLVHVRLFGGSYRAQLMGSVSKLLRL